MADELNAARLDARIDDLAERTDRTDERHEKTSRMVFQKLAVIERQVGKVERQLVRVSAQLDSEQRSIRHRLEKIDREQATHEAIFTGRNGVAGLLVRTDRIEQHVASSRWLLRAVIVTVITLCATSVARVLLTS